MVAEVGVTEICGTVNTCTVTTALSGQPGAPALYIERISYLKDGRPVEFTKSHYRGDAYDFVVELTTEQLSSGANS